MQIPVRRSPRLDFITPKCFLEAFLNEWPATNLLLLIKSKDKSRA